MLCSIAERITRHFNKAALVLSLLAATLLGIYTMGEVAQRTETLAPAVASTDQLPIETQGIVLVTRPVRKRRVVHRRHKRTEQRVIRNQKMMKDFFLKLL